MTRQRWYGTLESVSVFGVPAGPPDVTDTLDTFASGAAYEDDAFFERLTAILRAPSTGFTFGDTVYMMIMIWVLFSLSWRQRMPEIPSPRDDQEEEAQSVVTQCVQWL